jgi:hypothetical protein
VVEFLVRLRILSLPFLAASPAGEEEGEEVG